MHTKDKQTYYHIKANVFWSVITAIGLIFCIMICLLFWKTGDSTAESATDHNSTSYMEYGQIESKLQDKNSCYLCGTAPESLMGYYRQFDTIGIIGLNEWYVLDLRIQEYDENGKSADASSGTSYSSVNTGGINYSVNATPSRGMTHATLSSNADPFIHTTVQNHLCQPCLDKVTNTLNGHFEKGKEYYLPFCLVDFSTLELYPMQKTNIAYFVKDYWVELNHTDDHIEVKAYYLPNRTLETTKD